MTVADAPVTHGVVELRQYTHHPGQRDVLIDLFETRFIESQEAAGMAVLGQFRDLDRPDRFVWLRGFTEFESRAGQLHAFYTSDVWLANRDRANATLIDSDNVLLLRPAAAGSTFVGGSAPRPPIGASHSSTGLVVATIYSLSGPCESPFAAFFEKSLRPHLEAAGIEVLASLITDPRTNNYPRLPVREGEHVFVWFSRFASVASHERRSAALSTSPGWNDVTHELDRRWAAATEVLRLQPTARSLLRA